jgi:hypothetical protein
MKYSSQPKRVNKKKKKEDPKSDFLKARKEFNYIFSSLDSCKSNRLKVIVQEVMVVRPASLEYPLPLVEAITQISSQSRVDTLLLSAPSSRLSISTESSLMEGVRSTSCS